MFVKCTLCFGQVSGVYGPGRVQFTLPQNISEHHDNFKALMYSARSKFQVFMKGECQNMMFQSDKKIAFSNQQKKTKRISTDKLLQMLQNNTNTTVYLHRTLNCRIITAEWVYCSSAAHFKSTHSCVSVCARIFVLLSAVCAWLQLRPDQTAHMEKSTALSTLKQHSCKQK